MPCVCDTFAAYDRQALPRHRTNPLADIGEQSGALPLFSRSHLATSRLPCGHQEKITNGRVTSAAAIAGMVPDYYDGWPLAVGSGFLFSLRCHNLRYGLNFGDMSKCRQNTITRDYVK